MDPNDWIDVDPARLSYSTSHVCFPSHYERDVASIIIPRGIILDRIEKLAQLIVKDSKGPLIACCVLKGGHQFFADLMNQIKRHNNTASNPVPLSLEFIRVKSYSNTQSTGQISMSLSEDDLKQMKGKHVLVVDDIIDSGLTLSTLKKKLLEYEPASVRIATLLLKKTANKFIPDYVGFAIPDEFVIGYGLDYNARFRDLDHICIISDYAIQAYKE